MKPKVILYNPAITTFKLKTRSRNKLNAERPSFPNAVTEINLLKQLSAVARFNEHNLSKAFQKTTLVNANILLTDQWDVYTNNFFINTQKELRENTQTNLSF